ncbi:MFS transporter [Paenibacillus whitsoniae]|uniref:MFS transporter n=1 Tax=Paenibacillus whitsoniae TaxID=2496558 RepID=A0A430J636_9BACL|nr:MFS transporter [Paenibacillus whitsoniae]RTE03938.1 MFS transporter [Paenibacillus whitsoniae]
MTNTEERSRLWTTSFVCLTIASFLLFLNLQELLASFPAYAKETFTAGDVAVSLLTSLFALSAIATRFATAALMRKVHRNVLLFIGLGVAGLITLSYMWAGSLGSLLLMRIGYGIGFGMASTIIPTLVSQIIPASRIGEGIGYFGLSTSLAMSIGPMIGLNLMKHAGWPTLTLTGAVTAFAIFPLLLLSRAIPPKPQAAAPGDSGRASAAEEAVSFRKSKLLYPALLNVLLSITYSGLLSFIALFGQAVHLEQVGLFFLFNAITIVLIRPISGKLFDRKGPGAVLIPAAASVIASMLLLSFTTTMPLLIVSALLYGLGFGAIQPTIQAWMLRMTPKAQHSMANSLFYNSTDLGVAIGAFLLGSIAAVTGYATMYRYSAGFMLLFLILFIARLLFGGKRSSAVVSLPQ